MGMGHSIRYDNGAISLVLSSLAEYHLPEEKFCSAAPLFQKHPNSSCRDDRTAKTSISVGFVPRVLPTDACVCVCTREVGPMHMQLPPVQGSVPPM